MKELKLFTDGSVNPKLNIGYGAYLIINEHESFMNTLSSRIKIKRFENTSSTKLELQTFLWAINDLNFEKSKIIVYTDCQNIIGLKARRERFEKSDYFTKKGKRIKNYKLYREFYKITDKLTCEFIKVSGHKKSNQKDDIDRLFTLVDRASRTALRCDTGENL